MNTQLSELSAAVTEQLAACAPRYCVPVLRYFDRRSTDVATVDELTEVVCERTQSDTGEQTVAIQLHHSTLPKLDDVGLVDYDSRSRTVRHVGPPTMEATA